MSIYLGDTPLAHNAVSRNIGEIITSTIPLTDAGLHLLDGALISGSGSYSAFVTYISGLVTDYPGLFETEANWQQAVTDYGVCGKFVYDSVNDTVRLPKITGFTEGTIDPTKLGDLIEAGLPDHMHTVSITYGTTDGTFAHVDSATNNSGTKVYNSSYASTNNSIYGNSTTVQPQAIKVLYYIVIATSTKTNIEVDIDEVMTDLNGKADVDLSNVNASGTRLSGSWSMPSNRYIDLTLGATGAEYVAPANGYFSWAMSASAADQAFSLDYRGEGNTTWLLSSGRKSYANGDYIRMWLPVKKGEKVVTSYNGGTNSRFRFTYAEGDQ